MRTLSTRQARRFLLLKNGLIGGYRFKGKQGALDYVRQAGCVQYDPVDLCGRSADLTLLSRVKGYRKQDLQSLLYEDRALIDYFDKQLSILPAQDWPCFARERQFWQEHQTRAGSRWEQAAERVLGGRSRCAGRLPAGIWTCRGTRRLVLVGNPPEPRRAGNTLFPRRTDGSPQSLGNIKFYAKPSDMLPQELLDAPDPFPDEAAHLIWRVKRRIGAVGLLGDRASDAASWARSAGRKASGGVCGAEAKRRAAAGTRSKASRNRFMRWRRTKRFSTAPVGRPLRPAHWNFSRRSIPCCGIES